MEINIQYKENSTYSNAAIEAVRYGFQYRKEAEVYAIENRCKLNHCLSAPSDILLFLAEAIIGGIAYDVLKSVVHKTWEKLRSKKLINKDKNVHNINGQNYFITYMYVGVNNSIIMLPKMNAQANILLSNKTVLQKILKL